MASKSIHDMSGSHELKIEGRNLSGLCLFSFALLLLISHTAKGQENGFSTDGNFAQAVNTQIGNKGKDTGSDKRYHEAGFTFTGATYPFGMVQFTPTFFNPNKGFVINQLSGAGCENMGNLPMLPLKGIVETSPDSMRHYKPNYTLKKLAAGYYKSILFDDVETNLTVTKRTGFAKIVYSKTDAKGSVIIGTGINATTIKEASVKITSPNEFQGYADGGSFCGSNSNYKVYFAGRFNRTADKYGIWNGKKLQASTRHTSGPNSGVYFTFDLSGSQSISYKVGISYVSIKNARENLEASNPGWNFDQVKNRTMQKWNDYLGRINIHETKTDRAVQFYTHLYHALIHPSLFSDANGEYIGADFKVHKAGNFDYYTAFSNWDTYRTQIQLLSLLFPEKTEDIITSHLKFSQQSGGGFPRWVLANYETGIMQGDPTSILVANAYAFGATDFNTNAALSIMRRGAEVPGTKSQDVRTRPHLVQYLNKGYTDNASITLEYTSADFAIAQFAKQTMDDEKFYKKYLERAQNWKHLYNSKSTWLQSKSRNESWKPLHQGFREATYEDYFWMVPYNLSELIDTLGSKKLAEKRLDNYFRRLDADYNQTWYAAGNEPDFEAPWVYNWTNAPYKTQALVHHIIGERFSNKANGLPGNDDLGAMGAWYVFANMGLYPMIPGYGGFTLNSPSFSNITVALGSGEYLQITGGSQSKPYIENLKVNGIDWNHTWLPYDKVKAGAKLHFTLTKTPNENWGTKSSPPSFDVE